MHENKAKIVSLVPSWTETLLEANLNVVGRTRFCIHPANRVGAIAAVGGTKNLKIDEIIKLEPQFVILDKEENKKEMADALEAQGIEILVSHVSNIETAAQFLERLADQFSSSVCSDFSDLYRLISTQRQQILKEKFLAEILIQKNADFDFKRSEYVIWKDPFMVIGKNTFISDVMSLAGIELDRAEKYPQISENELKARYCFFSSEPFPFGREFSEMSRQGFRGALIDGEKVSWYGVRNLRFLQSCLD